jgi:DNA-3-methyladenine glycosylase
VDRAFFENPALEVAPRLLNCLFTVSSDEGSVTLRITEVEAYHGVGVPGPYDPGSHSRDRKTARNASMFGPPGHAYVYLSYGIHYAINLVCSPEASASGVLLRAAEVIDGKALARRRREGALPRKVSDRQLARGPGNLGQALGITRERHDGRDLFAAPFSLAPAFEVPLAVRSGPRVGVSGVAGTAAFSWRFWVADDPSVSAYRPGRGVS